MGWAVLVHSRLSSQNLYAFYVAKSHETIVCKYRNNVNWKKTVIDWVSWYFGGNTLFLYMKQKSPLLVKLIYLHSNMSIPYSSTTQVQWQQRWTASVWVSLRVKWQGQIIKIADWPFVVPLNWTATFDGTWNKTFLSGLTPGDNHLAFEEGPNLMTPMIIPI